MKYNNFWEAFTSDDEHALAIGKALEKAMASLVEQGLTEDSTSLWRSMCNQAWAFHVEKYYFGEG